MQIFDDRNLIVEFATRMRARKCFQHLIDKHGRDGPVTWKKAQWWPAPISYAQHQLDLISRKQRARKVLERENRRKQFEMRKMEDKLRREHDEIRTRKKKVRDGWFDSDEEQPSASSSSSNLLRRPHATVKRFRRAVHAATRVSKFRSASLIIWLASVPMGSRPA